MYKRQIYESVLNEVEEGVVISDHENRVIFINRAAEAIEGVDARMSLGKRMEELYLPVGNGKKKMCIRDSPEPMQVPPTAQAVPAISCLPGLPRRKYALPAP